LLYVSRAQPLLVSAARTASAARQSHATVALTTSAEPDLARGGGEGGGITRERSREGPREDLAASAGALAAGGGRRGRAGGAREPGRGGARHRGGGVWGWGLALSCCCCGGGGRQAVGW